MKAMPFLLAISLAANLILGLMLWQQHRAQAPDSVATQFASAPADSEFLPLPTSPVPLSAPAFLPPVGSESIAIDRSGPAGARARLLAPDEEKPYGPPLPPNPNAFPAWRERMPYRETQLHRTLLIEPKR